MRASDLDLQRDGAQLLPGAVGEAALARLATLPTSGPGARLHDPKLPELLQPVTDIAQALLPGAFPVRAVLFDKTPEANWSVAWHQDRTIAVTSRTEVAGFGPWTTKNGIAHVAPPADVIERMLTLRVHIDPCGPNNAPLRVAVGSHRLGMVAASQVAAEAARRPVFECHAAPRDVWAYVTTILHASERSRSPARRRVLQVDYAAEPLPGGLEWRGVA